ncbi:MAG: CPBP family intramembrane glutamic endopeptidase [Rikenellaceae bacterium]
MATTSDKEQQKPIVESSEKSKGRRVFPSYIDLAAIFGVYIITQIIAILITKISLNSLLIGSSDELKIGWLMLGSQIISMTLTIIFIYIIRRARQAPPIKIKCSLRGLDPTILLGGLLMLLSASIAIEPLLALLPPTPPVEGRGVPMLLSVVIGAPLFEEFICRGLIFESINNKRGVVMAWLISSLFFGVMHLDPSMVINAFVMGLILCYIYIRSNSILSPIILHSLNNGIAYLLIIAGFGDNTLLRDIIPSQTIYYIVYGLAIVILITSLFLCRSRFKLIAQQNQMESTPKETTQDQAEERAEEK